VAPPLTGEERRRRLRATRLYLIVGQDACRRGRWEDATARALDSGVIGMVQLREKDLSDAAFVERARALATLARRAGALLVLNDRVHLLRDVDADGVHVGEDDLSPRAARDAVGPDVLVGASAHDATEVGRAADAGADYAGLGPCFPSTTKTLRRSPGGAALVASGLAGARIPVFPIGGITRASAGALARAGATRLAVGAGILSDRFPRAAARAIRATLPP
jgi:thiamine-phosphate pyrophosphorylase